MSATLDCAHPAPIFTINFIRPDTVACRIRTALVWLRPLSMAANLTVTLWLIGSAVSLMAQRTSAPAALGVAEADMKPLYAQAQTDLTRLNAIISRETARFRAGGKLAVLTTTLPARTWITTISSDRQKRTLLIGVTYLIDPEQPYELPTKVWIDSLRSDPRFSQGLKRLELMSSSRITQGRANLFVFELAAEWDGPRAAR